MDRLSVYMEDNFSPYLCDVRSMFSLIQYLGLFEMLQQLRSIGATNIERKHYVE